MHLHAAGPEVVERALRGDRQRLDADDVLGPAGQMHLAGRDHRRDAAVACRVDPAELVLARRPVAEHRVHVAVDQPGRDGGALARRSPSSAPSASMSLALADRGDAAVDGDDGVGVEDRPGEVAATAAGRCCGSRASSARPAPGQCPEPSSSPRGPASRLTSARPCGICLYTNKLWPARARRPRRLYGAAAMSHLNEERVLAVTHWTPDLFSFTTTRNASFRFRSGQFTMIGIEVEGRPLLRAYSLDERPLRGHPEVLLQHQGLRTGPLTSRLQHLKEGDPIVVGRKATGTLVLDSLMPGRNLYLLGTGTGLAPLRQPRQGPGGLRALRARNPGPRLTARSTSSPTATASSRATARGTSPSMERACDREARLRSRPSPASRSATAAASTTISSSSRQALRDGSEPRSPSIPATGPRHDLRRPRHACRDHAPFLAERALVEGASRPARAKTSTKRRSWSARRRLTLPQSPEAATGPSPRVRRRRGRAARDAARSAATCTGSGG